MCLQHVLCVYVVGKCGRSVREIREILKIKGQLSDVNGSREYGLNSSLSTQSHIVHCEQRVVTGCLEG